MSVKELKLSQDNLNSMRVNKSGNIIFFTSDNKQGQSMCVGLNRSEAHFLLLWLQEHLK